MANVVMDWAREVQMVSKRGRAVAVSKAERAIRFCKKSTGESLERRETTSGM
jgi:hypothetical protein